MPSLPRLSREVRLAVTPDGLPQPEHFVIVDTPVPALQPGQVLVRNRFFQVSARLRPLLSGATEGTPLPTVRPGDSLPSATIGEVVTAPGDSGLRPGELVAHWLGWREYAVLPASDCAPLGDALPDPVAHLGSGWTAYTALTRYGRLKPGETVLVTGGAGGVGSLAGQIARRLGAALVVGTTGTPEKVDKMRSELGYDAVLIRGAAPFATQLAQAAPDGIDVLVDNVGGDQLRAAAAAARPGARLVLVGTLAGQLSPHGSGGSAPVELDAFQLILKGITIRGLVDPRDPVARSDWTERFGDWLRSGEMTFPHVRVQGIDRAAQALLEVFNGLHLGTVVVEL
ncbi:NADP-dependent oxidoreductase [Amycolatopsis rhizosphaerae]|uniref:NADP-dependent oxidoreductase n=1 Tax=Amycolatopsis rhizosphaerae TaxID=2053003 RepID=A0A558BQH2_9PSEU|nr:NADP-dependent oxidoreductase [Amycolatopsis rhizosphaerae]TVT38733.1 NADP-dependent oxidoreductase [Amycolatopsis rhizosphaerae]